MIQKYLSRHLPFIFLLLVFSSPLAFSEDAVKSFTCAPKVQKTSKEAPWRCPDPSSGGSLSGDSLYAELGNINYEAGDYTCVYRFVDTGKPAGSCTYLSSYYSSKIQEIQKEMVPQVGEKYKGVAFWKNIDIKKINFLDIKEYPGFIDSAVVPLIDRTLQKLQDIYKESKKVSDSSIANIDRNLASVRTLTYENLVKPYIDPTAQASKEYNFSTFLAGLITLDPGVVRGYSEASGKLVLQNNWRAAAIQDRDLEKRKILEKIGDGLKSGWDAFVSFITFDFFQNDKSREELQKDSGNTINYEIHSWIDIFEMKLWGFYYHLQERLDIAYDYVATQILLIMFGWFAAVNGLKGGVQYLLAKRGNSDHNVLVMNEERWMRTLTTVLAVGVFYISLPSTSSIGGNSDDNAMRKNLTIAKGIIRIAAKEGSYIGTMVSDLGMDAYMSFLIKKQNLNSAKDIMDTYSYSLMSFPAFFPAYQTVRECSKFYGVPPGKFTGIVDNSVLNSGRVPEDDFFTKNRIKSIAYSECVASYRLSRLIPYDLVYSSKEAQAKIDDLNSRMAKVMNFIVRNQISLQVNFGWVNTLSVPVSYFLMKNNDMFLSQGLDYDKIRKSATAYINASEPYRASDIHFSDAKTIKGKIGLAFGTASDYAGEGVAWLSSQAAGLMMWNMLPGFNDIFQGIHGYLDKIWSDYVMYDANGNEGASSKKEGGGITSILKNIMHIATKAVKFVAAPVAKVFSFIAPDTLKSTAMRTAILLVSLIAAIFIWKMAFSVFFIAIISISILVKIGLYFVHLLIHVVTSLYVAAWAFASKEQGYGKMKAYLQRTLVLTLYPSLIVISTYLFIFVYELFYTLYAYIINIMIEGQKINTELLLSGNSNGDAFSAYFTLQSLGQMGEITIDFISLGVGLWIIFSLPKIILGTMGISEDPSMSISGSSQEIYQRGPANMMPVNV